VACYGACADLSSDPAHCGECDRECPDDAECVSGSCACPAGTVACRDRCADLSSDAEHCGECANRCPAGSECVSGDCSCPAGLAAIAGVCVDVSRDVLHCGVADHQCSTMEYCVDGECECRPGLTRVAGGRCTDLESDPNACGDVGTHCEDVCSLGDCAERCADGLEECNDACVDTETDPLNCGECGRRCAVDEVCAGGECRDFETGAGCDACPCDACRSGDACCTYPGTTDVICVDERCP
jgi:hypothetical protein